VRNSGAVRIISGRNATIDMEPGDTWKKLPSNVGGNSAGKCSRIYAKKVDLKLASFDVNLYYTMHLLCKLLLDQHYTYLEHQFYEISVEL
jgi:hypothetical protein